MTITVNAFGKNIQFPAGTQPEEIEKHIANNRALLDPDYESPSTTDKLKQFGKEFVQNSLGVDMGVNGRASGVAGIIGSVDRGARQTGRMIGATSDTIRGNLPGVEQYGESSRTAAQNETPEEQMQLLQELQQVDRDQSVTGQIGDTLSAAGRNKMGTAQLITEQLPNTAVALGGGYAGFKAGAATGSLFGPAGAGVGGVLGFLGGMFLGNTILETGAKAIEKSDDGFTEGERNDALKEGAIKGGVITAVDAATLGIGGKVTGALSRAAERAGARAEAKVLIDAGVDMSSIATINSALAVNPALIRTAKIAGEKAAISSLSASRKAGIAGTGVALETVGEGAGEYLGELAATGEPDVVDATIEALAGLSQSSIETAYNYNKIGGRHDIKDVQKQASQINEERTKLGLSKIESSGSVDEAIQAASETVSQKPVTTGDIFDDSAKREALLSQINQLTGNIQQKSTETLQNQTLLKSNQQLIQSQPEQLNDSTESDITAQKTGKGANTEIVLPDNTTLPAQWEVVDADSIKATLKNGENQPRDRSRAASDIQVQQIANNPDYRRLAESPVMDIGSPTVSYDGAIVGGNGRFEGISRGYDAGTSAAYRAALESDAINKGIDPATFAGMKKPVLVRRITQPFDTKKLAVASNSGTSLEYSALERAKIDSERIGDIGQIEVTDSGDIALTKDNISNVRNALKGYSTTELGSFVDNEGNLSQEGARRLKNAILYSAYGDSKTLSRMVESTDTDMRNVIGALTRVAGQVSKVRSDIKAGGLPKELDVTDNLIEAVEKIGQLRANGSSVQEYLAQQSMFPEIETSQESKEIVQVLSELMRSQKRMTEFMRSMYDSISKVDITTQNIFGEQDIPTKLEVIKHAKRQQEQSGTDNETDSAVGQKPATEKDNAGSGKESAKYSRSAEERLKDRVRSKRLERRLNEEGYDFKIKAQDVRLGVTPNGRGQEAIAAEQIARIFKKRITWIESEGEFEINGVMTPSIPDTIFIDVNSNKASNIVMGHELSHHMEQDVPEVYRSMVDALMPMIRDTDIYRTSRKLDDMSEANVIKEIVGDIMGDNFTQPEFWNKVAAYNPNAFRKIADTIISWIKKLVTNARMRGLGSEQWVTDAKKAQDIVAKAVSKYTSNISSISKEKTGSVKSYSQGIGSASGNIRNLDTIQSALKEADKFAKSDIAFLFGYEESSSKKNQSNGLITDSEVLANISESAPVIKHGFGGIDIPSKMVMFGAMGRMLKNDKVRNLVVESVPVDVMNVLTSGKIPPDVLFHDMPMLFNLLSINGDKAISANRNATSETASVIAVMGAKAAILNVASSPNKLRAALLARERDFFSPALYRAVKNFGGFESFIADAKNLSAVSTSNFGHNNRKFVEYKGNYNTVFDDKDVAITAKFSFAGQNSKTADKHQLSTAQERLAKGEDAETVRKETGWFKGVDNRWRYEIDDSKAEWNPEIEKSGLRPYDAISIGNMDSGSRSPWTVGELINHDSLYAAYPKIKEIKVNPKQLGRSAASYRPKDNAIFIRMDDPENMLSSMLHEIQHGIQGIEGFAEGGSPDILKQEYTKEEARNLLRAKALHSLALVQPDYKVNTMPESALRIYEDFFKEKPNKDVVYLAQYNDAKNLSRLVDDARRKSLDPDDQYLRLAGEVEARNVQFRRGMSDKERRDISPESTQDIPSSEAIIVYNGKVMDNAPVPANVEKTDKSKSKQKEKDSEYMAAIKSGDMDKAQRMVDAAAREKGYISGNDYRMMHQAPNRDDYNLATIKESGIVPKDYWTHPHYYQSDYTERESFYKVNNAIESIDRYKEKGIKRNPSLWVYRAVPKDVKDSSFRNGDWVSPSRDYARTEGAGIPEGYKIIAKRVPLSDLWWDANSINELGYDDGKEYVYQNTKNNRKLIDPVTYDNNGKVIPLSKRFNKREYDARFSRSATIPDTITIDGKERQTRNSEGKLIHPTEEGIRNFWRWFGDSKVVDNDGRPLVVYHGTRKDFNKFSPSRTIKAYGNAKKYGDAIYLTSDIREAEDYAIGDDNDYLDEKSKIMELYASINNDSDGIIKTSTYNDSLEIIVFNPLNIKSSSVNTGQFSPNNDDIRFSRSAGDKEINQYLNDYKIIHRNLLSDDFIKNNDFEAWTDLIDQAFEIRNKIADKLENREINGLGVEGDALLSRNANGSKNPWRVTYFDDNGEPNGHSEYKNAKSAVSDFLNPSRSEKLISLFSRSDTLSQAGVDTKEKVKETGLPEETRLQAFRRRSQDAMLRFKVVQKWLKEQGISLSEAANVYQRENISKGKTANKIEDFRREQLEPLIKRIAETSKKASERGKFDLGDIATYLEAVHIPEANERMRLIHKDDKATANGITDDQARKVIKEFEAMPNFAEFKDLAEEMRDIGSETLDMRLDNGLISQEQYDAYKSAYKNWVPLRGNMSQQGFGKGLSTNAKDKRRMGHGFRESEFVIENLVQDRERALMQIEKNKVGMSVATFLMEAANPNIGTIDEPQKMRVMKDFSYAVTYKGRIVGSFENESGAKSAINRIMEGRGDLLPDGESFTQTDFYVEKSYDPHIVMMAKPQLAENEIQVYVNGHAVKLQLNDPGLARAATNAGIEQVGSIIHGARMFNRFLSKAYTAWSPDFLFMNMARDAYSGTLVLTGKKGATFAAKVFGNYGTAIKELIKGRNDPKRSQWVTRYRAAGGNIGAAYLSDLDRVGEDAVAALHEFAGARETYRMVYNEQISKGASEKKARTMAALKAGAAKTKAMPVVGHLFKTIERVNMVIENALRLATFKTAVEQGESEQQAAMLSKDLMNFNRKGEVANTMGALYLFYNPGMQGAHIVGEALFTSPHKKQVWALLGALTSLSFMLAELTRGGGDDDDEREWENIPEYIKDRNLIFKYGDKQITVPVAYGFGIFHAMGNYLSDMNHGADMNEVAVKLASGMFENFSVFGNPLLDNDGNTDIRPEQLSPTFLKLIMGPGINMDSLGRQIQPDKATWNQSVPDSQNMFRSVRGTAYEDIAHFMNDITGGSKYNPGAVDISPNTIKYWVTSLTGGAGRFVSDVTTGAAGAAEGVSPELENIPVLRKFIREPGVADSRAAFHKARKEAEAANQRFNKALKDGDVFQSQKMLDENQEIIALANFAGASAKLAASKRDLVLDIQQDKSLSKAERRLKIKDVEVSEQRVYDDFLRYFDDAKMKVKK